MLVIENDVNTFLRQTLVGVLGTTEADGSPHLAPIWYNWEDGSAYMFTSRKSRKWRNIQARPYASLCVNTRDVPYSAIILSGPVKGVDKTVFEVVSSMSYRYYGEQEGEIFAEWYRENPTDIVAFKLTADRIVKNLNV